MGFNSAFKGLVLWNDKGKDRRNIKSDVELVRQFSAQIFYMV